MGQNRAGKRAEQECRCQPESPKQINTTKQQGHSRQALPSGRVGECGSLLKQWCLVISNQSSYQSSKQFSREGDSGHNPSSCGRMGTLVRKGKATVSKPQALTPRPIALSWQIFISLVCSWFFFVSGQVQVPPLWRLCPKMSAKLCLYTPSLTIYVCAPPNMYRWVWKMICWAFLSGIVAH